MTPDPLIPILIADDDADDREMTKEAFREGKFNNPLVCVEDGETLMDYLHKKGSFSSSQTSGRPGLILLDLNMPKKSGREALAEIKADPFLRSIPVVVFTTSEAQKDIASSYDLGANSFITKPTTVEGLAQMAATLRSYWFGLVSLPKETS